MADTSEPVDRSKQESDEKGSNREYHLTSEVDVAFARNDARTFREYAAKTLGLPRRNIVYLEGATAGRMSQVLHKLNMLAKNSGGKRSFISFMPAMVCLMRRLSNPVSCLWMLAERTLSRVLL